MEPLDVGQYVEEKDDSRIEEWIRECDEKASQEKELTAYVLRHDTERNDRRWTQFLIYLPNGDDNFRIEAHRQATLFGKMLRVYFLTDSELEEEGGYRLCTVSCSTDKISRVEVYRNVRELKCEMTKVDYDLTLFEIVPQE